MFKERQVIKEILEIFYLEDDGTINPDKEWDGETVEKVAEILNNHDFVPDHVNMKPNEQIAVVWDASNVIGRAADLSAVSTEGSYEVTVDEAIDIIEQMERRHDCCYGITWDTVDYHIEKLFREKKEEEEEQNRRDEKNGLYPGKEDPCN